MVEIRYGDYYEVAELAGQSVTDARQQFRAELGIPEKARAKLNGKKVDTKLESEISLCDDDKLSFAEAKSRKGAYLAGALLLALAVTGGTFAWTATTDTLSMGLAEKTEFVTVTPDPSPPTWNVFKGYKGVSTTGELFKITPADGFSGDLSAGVLLANSDNLVGAYRVLVMKISIYADDESGLAANTTDKIGTTQYLTLSKGEITIDIVPSTHVSPFWVYLDSGFYVSHGSWTANEEDPLLLCDVAQKGL